MTLGEKIILAREMVGMTAAELAKKIGVKPPTVSRWERGENRPSPRHWIELTKALGKPREWFKTDDRADEISKRIEELENQFKTLDDHRRTFDQDELTLLRLFDKTKGNSRLRDDIIRQVRAMIGDNDQALPTKKRID